MLRHRQPIMRAAATTAVVAETANAVAGRHQQGPVEAQADDPQPPGDEQTATEDPVIAPTPPAPGLSEEAMERLKQLAALRDQGVLTEQEFTSETVEILNA